MYLYIYISIYLYIYISIYLYIYIYTHTQIIFYSAFECFDIVTVGYFWAKGVPVCSCTQKETIFDNESLNYIWKCEFKLMGQWSDDDHLIWRGE